MQQTLFGESGGEMYTEKNLVINKKHAKAQLTKAQQAFNRLVKRVEKLQEELKVTAGILEEKLKYYAEHIYPLQKNVALARTEVIKLVFSYYTNKKLFSKKERQVIKEFLEMQMGEVFANGEAPDEEMKKIFEAVHGIKFEDAAEEDFEDMKAEMESMFEGYGFDINLDGLHSKMTPEEIMAKMAEMGEQFKNQAQNRQQDTGPKKTKKQIDKEEKEKQVEEAKKKNINVIYRQLAKIVHPDLETDEVVKLEKEEIMKRLTVAYENNDLHTLLRLEMQWIQKEENDPAKLTDDKLTIYNEVMKEQVAGLENELFELENHPRFAPLQKMADYAGQAKSLVLEKEKTSLKKTLKDMHKCLANLKMEENVAVREIREIIRYFSAANGADEEFVDFEEVMALLMQAGRPQKRR